MALSRRNYSKAYLTLYTLKMLAQSRLHISINICIRPANISLNVAYQTIQNHGLHKFEKLLRESPNRCKDDVLLQIPGASVHLTGDGEAVELAKGELTILIITAEDVSLATVVTVGPHLLRPLTKDAPVNKLDKLHYLCLRCQIKMATS